MLKCMILWVSCIARFINPLGTSTPTDRRLQKEDGTHSRMHCLDQKELSRDKSSKATAHALENCLMTGQQPIASEEELNLSSGVSRTLLERIVEKEVRERARNKALEEQKEAIRLEKISNYKEGTRVTAGITFNGHGCHLNSEVLQRVQDINNQRRQKEEAAVTKALEKEEKFKHKVE